MSSVMIIAPTVWQGRKYALKHGLNWRHVIAPGYIYPARGRSYDDFVVVGGARLDVDEWAALTPTLFRAGEKVLDRFFYEAQGKLPPPIELERETVIKF